ncbi:unnamed protein product [Blepharisma stoltei]|uniref:Uncharacterized protein n=1 Tax=Blepharisma stoltei TaxID=1481888 RepID=A0AAU9JMW5_9CILI|nr:unnamed protein product [Blepharisma stoltei]
MVSIGDILAMIVDDNDSCSDISGSEGSNWSSGSYDSQHRRYNHGCSSCGYCRSCYDKYGCNKDSFDSMDLIFQDDWETPIEFVIQDTTDQNYWNSFFSETIKCTKNFYFKRNSKKMKNDKVFKKANLLGKNNWKNEKIQNLKRKSREKAKKVDYLNGWY